MIILLLASIFVPLEGQADKPWDLNGPCQPYVEKFAVAQANMVQCATNWSIPPKICTNCFEQYINFKQVEYETHHLDSVISLNNKTCTEVIYNNYVLSYSKDISEALTTEIWESSRCLSCLNISWNLEKNDTRVDFLNRTIEFQQKIFGWRDCVTNFTDDGMEVWEGNSTEVCTICKQTFNELFAFYWGIYSTPGVEFCLDVETTMNDTLHLWNDVWQCAEKKDRVRDSAFVVWTFVVLVIVTVLFYASSYIQGGGAVRNLINYSQMNPPEGTRYRLLSTSASDHAFST